MKYEDKEMALTEHLEELRRRLITTLIAVAVATAIVWGWSGEFLEFLAGRVGGLVFTAPTEAFFTRFKVALFGGFLLALPVVLHQAWAFTACAMGEGMRRAALSVLPLSYLLFLAGVSLSVLVVVPRTTSVLLAFGSTAVRPMLSVGAFVDFMAALSLAFGAVFQIPLILTALQRAGIVTPEGLAARRRYAWFAAFVLAAALTPGPDVFSQLALATPMVVLFELSLLLMRRGAPRAAAAAREETAMTDVTPRPSGGSGGGFAAGGDL